MSSPSHDFAALAQERRDIQIFLLEVRDHRATHAIQRNHLGAIFDVPTATTLPASAPASFARHRLGNPMRIAPAQPPRENPSRARASGKRVNSGSRCTRGTSRNPVAITVIFHRILHLLVQHRAKDNVRVFMRGALDDGAGLRTSANFSDAEPVM